MHLKKPSHLPAGQTVPYFSRFCKGAVPPFTSRIETLLGLQGLRNFGPKQSIRIIS